MARPRQDGLLYFSFDTDFFYADKRIKRFHSKYGNDGLILYIYLLAEIYRNGYYIDWDEETADDIASDLHLKDGFIEQVLTYLVSRSLLTMRTLAGSVTVITSPGIQKRYQEAKKGCKRQIEVDPDIWLLNENETESCIKVMNNDSNSEKNQSNSEKNQSNSEKNHIKENKEKKSKVNNKNMCKADADALFERLWQMYPVKKGKGQISDAKKRRLLETGFDEMSRAIGRYLEGLKKDEWRKPQNGSTFFNSGYIDYLDSNYGDAQSDISPVPEIQASAPELDMEPEESVGDDEEWWKYGMNAWED
ncbi:DUF4373 domain-containing protein [bacterium 1XD8-76]|nr:DUF4373 domain-containing protein [bacterium 1XD8-76]